MKRLVKLTKDAEEKLKFFKDGKGSSLKIEDIKKKIKKKGPVLDTLFNNLFKLGEKHELIITKLLWNTLI